MADLDTLFPVKEELLDARDLRLQQIRQDTPEPQGFDLDAMFPAKKTDLLDRAFAAGDSAINAVTPDNDIDRSRIISTTPEAISPERQAFMDESKDKYGVEGAGTLKRHLLSFAADFGSTIGSGAEYIGQKVGSTTLQEYGQKAQDQATAIRPTDQSFGEKISGGVGSMASMLATAAPLQLVASAAPVVAGIAAIGTTLPKIATVLELARKFSPAVVSGVFESAAEATGTYDNIFAKTGNAEYAAEQADKTFLANLPLTIGMDMASGLFKVADKAQEAGEGFFKATAKAARAEFAQEGGQAVIGNINSGDPWGKDVTEQATLGGIVGGGVRAVQHIVTPADIAKTTTTDEAAATALEAARSPALEALVQESGNLDTAQSELTSLMRESQDENQSILEGDQEQPGINPVTTQPTTLTRNGSGLELDSNLPNADGSKSPSVDPAQIITPEEQTALDSILAKQKAGELLTSEEATFMRRFERDAKADSPITLDTNFTTSRLEDDLSTLGTSDEATQTKASQAQPSSPKQPAQELAFEPVTDTDRKLTETLRERLGPTGSAREVKDAGPVGGAIQRITKLFGTNVRYFETTNTPSVPDGFHREGNTLWINTRAGINPGHVAFHEWKHSLRVSDSKAHDSLNKAAAEVLRTSPERLNAAALHADPTNSYGWFKADKTTRAEIVLDENGNYVSGFDESKIIDEVAADLSADHLMDPEFMKEVFDGIHRQHPFQKAKAIIEKIVNSLSVMIDKLLLATGKQGFKTAENIGLSREELVTFRNTLKETARKAFIREQVSRMKGQPMYVEGVTDTAFAARRDRTTESIGNSDRSGVIVGAKPGAFGWSPQSNTTLWAKWKEGKAHGPLNQGDMPPPFGGPTQGTPNQAIIGEAVFKILKSKDAQSVIGDLLKASEVELSTTQKIEVLPTQGSWLGQPERSFKIVGLTFAQSDVVSKLFGFAIAQDMAIVTEPVANPTEGTDVQPGIAIGNGRKFDEASLKPIIEAAKKEGIDYTLATDGYTVQFGYGPWLPFKEVEFRSKVQSIASATKMTATPYMARSKANFAGGYRDVTERIRAVVQGRGDDPSASGPSDLFTRTVDHILIPYARAVGGQGYRFSPDLFAERFNLGNAEREYIRAALRPKSGYVRSTAKIVSEIELAGREPKKDEELLVVGKSSGTDKKPVSNNSDVFWALQNRVALTGLIEPGDYSPEAKKVIAQALEDEIAHHVLRPDGKSAIGWYDAALAKAKAIYHRVFQELNTNPDREMLFDALLGIASQGNDVHANSIFAGRMYYLITRESMTIGQAVKELTGTFGEQSNAIENNFLKLEQLLKVNGYDRMRKILNKQGSVSDIKAMLRADKDLYFKGKPLEVDGLAEQTVRGWMVFGPKIGSFINNLHGDYSTLTADLWFSRTWNRILGFSFLHTPMQEAPKYQAFKEALIAEFEKTTEAKKINDKGERTEWDHGDDLQYVSRFRLDSYLADPAEMLRIAERIEELHRTGIDFNGKKTKGYSTKSDLRRAAKNWIEHRQDAVAAPRVDSERAFQQSVMETAQKLLKKRHGITITIADMQAALWYHEKELFGKFGAGDSKAEPADYADAAEKFMKKYNDGDLFYVEKPAPRYIRGAKGSYKSNAPDTGPKFSAPRSNASGSQSNGSGDAAPIQTGESGSVSGTGIHYSKVQQKALVSSFFGTGAKAAELERIQQSDDKRIKHRIYFYVNTGKGINQEFGVGPHAHKADLSNLYDMTNDPLDLWVGRTPNEFESATLDAGFDGVISQDSGIAILLGQRSVPVEYLGMGLKPEVSKAGSAEPSAYQSQLRAIQANKSLPGGQLLGSDWKRLMPKLMPSVDVSHLQDGEKYYKSGLVQKPGSVKFSAHRLAPNGKPSNLNEAQWHQVRTKEFIAWFGDWERHAKAKNPVGSLWSDDSVSKVVDENGEPLVVYHGAKRGGFTVMRPDKGDKHRSPMVFAAATKETARTYAGHGTEIDLSSQFEVLEVDGKFLVNNKPYPGELQYAYKFDTREEAQDNIDVMEEDGTKSGVYHLFLNIRNPNESDFEGANWDGQPGYEQYAVYDVEADEIQYDKHGVGVMSEDGANRFARQLAEDGKEYEVRQAPRRFETTNSVAEEAKRFDNDGAIIRAVVDDGGKYGAPDADDVFVFFNSNQAKSATQNTGAFSSSNPDLRYSAIREISKAWEEISTDEGVFQYPISNGKTLKDIAGDLDSKLTVVGAGRSPSELKRGLTSKSTIYMPNEKQAYLMEDSKGNVWLDASALESGISRGSLLYALAGNYAFNSGKVFIGDPGGLSDKAAVRRTEHMLSLALKFGTTKHIGPGERQVNPNHRFDLYDSFNNTEEDSGNTPLRRWINPLTWKTGSHDENLTQLMKAAYANTVKLAPEIRDVKWNSAANQFQDRSREAVDFDELSARVGKLAPSRGFGHLGGSSEAVEGDASTATSRYIVGSATLKRAAITNALLRGKVSGRLGEVVRELRGSGVTKGVLYSAPRLLADDLEQQQVYLTEAANDAGYTSIDEFVSGDLEGFMRAAESWRVSHPEEALFSASKSLGTLTSAEEQALRNVGAITKPKTLKDRLNAIRDLNWKAGMVDQFNEIKSLDPRAYMMARMSKGADGTMAATVLYGPPVMNGDVPDVDVSDPSGGFAKVLASLKGEHDRFLWWVAAQRAESIKTRHKEAEAKYQQALVEIKKFKDMKSEAQKNNSLSDYKKAEAILNQLRDARDQLKAQAQVDERLFSDTDLSTLKGLNNGKFPDGTSRGVVFGKALQQMNEYNMAVLEIAKKSGLIDQAAIDIFKDQPYVPFYRVMDDKVGGGKFSAGLVNQKPWEKFKGSERMLNEDLLQNVLMNWSHLLTASARNRAAVASLAAAKRLGIAESVPSDTKGAVKVRVNGESKAFTVSDPHLLMAITAIENATPAWWKPFMAPKQWLTWGVTLSPYFKIRNLVRDSISAIGQSDLGVNGFANIHQGWNASNKGSQTYASMLAGGGVMHFNEELNDNNTRKTRREIAKASDHVLDQNGLQKLGHKMRDLFDAYQDLGEQSENINRAALYEQLIKKGYSHADAAFMARDLLDFSMSGRWPMVRFLAQSVPFLNARLQGLYKLGRAGKENPQRLAYVAGSVMMASLALLFAYHDDDDWKNLTDEMRDTYWHVKIGSVWFKIPKPFEIGTIGTVAERTMEAAFLNNEADKWQRWRDSFSRSIFTTFAFDPTFQIAKPVIEVWANKDGFTKRPIESAAMQKMKKEDRATENTTQVAHLLSSLGLPDPASLMKGDYEKLSPVQIDHLVKGYFGWTGGAVLATADFALRPAMGKGDKPAKDVLAWISGGMADEIGVADSSRYVSAFYEQVKRIEEVHTSYQAAIKSGDTEAAKAIKLESGEDLNRYKMTENQKAQIGFLTRNIKKIEADKTIPADEKRLKIDAINAKKAKIAQQYMTLH